MLRGVTPRRGQFGHGGHDDAQLSQGAQVCIFCDGSKADEADATELPQSPRLRLTASRASPSSAKPLRASASEMMSGGLMRREGL